jgi:hypothetical protein
MTAIKPWTVGEEAVYVVGLEGRITAIGEDSITIAGHTLPTRLNHEAGVRYLSMIWPDEPAACNREHVDDSHSEEHPEREALADLVEMIRERHEGHPDSMRFCSDALCRVAAEADAEVLA